MSKVTLDVTTAAPLMPRSYAKKAPYWNQPRKPIIITDAPQTAPVPPAVTQAAPMEGGPDFDGSQHFSALAACGGNNVSPTAYRDQASPAVLVTDRYPNIQSIGMPFDTTEDNYGVSNTISVCYQAYFGYAVLRNAINLLCDFSISRVHVKTPNKRLKSFIETWFDAINLNQFMTQFFLEYYRSGNVFIYKWSGKISEDGFNMLKESYSSAGESIAKKSPVVPIRYTILNPMQIYLQRGASYTYGYVRMLSTYEIERLKNPQTDEDKQLFKSFPEDIQRQIKQGGAWRWLFVPLDQNRLYYVFYRKQDYEPLAVPLAFPVLNDIEFKLNLRRMDTALANTVEQVLLLVTTGRAADQWNQVAGAKNLAALQTLFQTQTVGRVLIADYTTKAEWKIPDIKELLGPEKYARVDQDIKEGLQYMFFGEDKFANASIKTRIFVEGLKEGRRAFIENFLLPEVKKICEIMKFQNIPELEFEEIQIQDEAVMNRLYVQLAQLGVLDPTETFTAMKTGLLPTKDESIEHQSQYATERLKGLYQPLVGGPAGGGAMNGRPPGSPGTPAPRQVSTPIGQKKAIKKKTVGSVGDLEESRFRFGMMKVADNIVKMNALKDAVEVALAKQFEVTELNDAQRGVAASVAQSVIFNEEDEAQWSEFVMAYVKEPKEISAETRQELSDIAVEFGVDSWMAAVLSRSKVEIGQDGRAVV